MAYLCGIMEKAGPGDYYFNERGLMVFTEAYHLKRGYCCGSGCRHCPYTGGRFSKEKRKKQDEEDKR